MHLFDDVHFQIIVDPLFVTIPNRRWPYGEAAHMSVVPQTEDALNHLHDFAQRLGLKRMWFQDEITSRGRSKVPHYDITRSMHERAIARGALLLTTTEFIARITYARACKGIT